MKRAKKALIFGLFLLLAMAISFLLWAAYVDTIHPKTMGMTIVELEAQIGNLEQVNPHIHNGNSYTVGYGTTKTIYLPSGPPVYVFDGAGKLVDWTPDVGDDPEFRVKWGL